VTLQKHNHQGCVIGMRLLLRACPFQKEGDEEDLRLLARHTVARHIGATLGGNRYASVSVARVSSCAAGVGRRLLEDRIMLADVRRRQ